MKTKAQILQAFDKLRKKPPTYDELKSFLSSSLDSAIEAVRVENKKSRTQKVHPMELGWNSAVSSQDEKIKRFKE